LIGGGSDGSFAMALFIISIKPMVSELLICLEVTLLTDGRNDVTVTSTEVTKTKMKLIVEVTVIMVSFFSVK
jgi:hypothetical protein